MRRHTSLLVAVVLVVALAARAQDMVTELPPQYTIGEVSQWLDEGTRQSDARWRDRVLERFRPELAAGRYLTVLEALAAESRAGAGQHGGQAGAVFQAEFDALLSRFRTELQAAAIADSVKTVEQRAAVLEGMGMRGADTLRPDSVMGGGFTFEPVYFADTDHELALYEPLGDGRFRLLVPPDVVMAMRLRGDAVHAVFMDFVDPVQRRQYEAIVEANQRWANYLTNGYSQYPWEALVNGAVQKFHAFDPPGQQLILAHPSLALETSHLKLDEVTASEVLTIELLGYLWYHGQSGEHFTGFSVAAVLRDDGPPGLGPVVHLRRNVSFGVAWHDDDGNGKWDEDPHVFMSLDVFRFWQAEGPRFRDAYETARSYLD